MGSARFRRLLLAITHPRAGLYFQLHFYQDRNLSTLLLYKTRVSIDVDEQGLFALFASCARYITYDL
jgi:hypothetical protein